MTSQQGGGRQPAGIRDVARLAGVSVASVSFALNGQPGVADDTRQRILAAAAQLGYRANTQAQALRRGRTTTYGLVIRNFSNPFFLEVLTGAERAASDAGATLLLLDSHYSAEREHLLVREMAAQRLAGLAIAPVGKGESLRLWQELRPGTPVVALNAAAEGIPGVSRVYPDNVAGVELAMRRLAELGHSCVAFLSAPRGLVADPDRLRHFRRLARVLGVQPVVMRSPLTITDVRKAAGTLLARPDAPTAIITNSDYTALGIYKTARDLSLQIGPDVSVIGHDDLPTSELLDPPLATIRLDGREMGRALMARLLGDGGSGDYVAPVELVERASLQAPGYGGGRGRSVSGRHAPLTIHRRLGHGAVLRHGRSTPYRAIEIAAGEPHLVRDDFKAGPEEAGPASAPGRPLLCLVHITDLQLADVQSPTRFEFLNARFADPRYAEIIPVQRPQEALTAHAVDATLRTLGSVHGPATGRPAQLAVTTGDAIDNAQWNELQAFLALFDGGLVSPDSGGPGYEGVQAPDWPGDIFWRPDGPGAEGFDFFRREFGYPHHPGLLERALREFSAAGLSIPWLSCFGNHEALNQGVGTQTPGLGVAMTGGMKPVSLPEDFDHDEALVLFTERPEAFMAGPQRQVTPDPFRRPITRRDFVDAHLRAGSRPFGHGFTERNRLDGTAYYVYDTPTVRFIALDTNCLAGGASGCLDARQARWLETRLAEVHSAYRGADGGEVRTGQDDRLVIVFSHHGTDTLDNSRGGHEGPDGEPLLGAGLVALLHRYPNVVLWLNGHTHTNTIRPRPDPGDPARGFWEVTTCAVVDWPCQTRVVELLDHGEYLSIVTTMVDHDTPAAPPVPLATSDDLAALHRELAANVPWDVSVMAGTAADRNVELRLAPPFPLKRLPGA